MDIEALKTAIKAHQAAKKRLDKAKVDELVLRLTVADMIAGAVDKRREGANTLPNAADYGFKKLSVVQPINRKADPVLLDAHKADLGDELFSTLFRFKPEVVDAPFRAIMAGQDKKIKLILGTIVTESPGTPALEIK